MISPPHDAELLSAGGLVVEWTGGHGEAVVSISLNRPHTRNSQSVETWQGLRHIGEVLPAGTRIVIVRGEGGTFSSGLDRSAFDPAAAFSLSSMADLPDDVLSARISEFQAGFAWLSDNPSVISIAAVDGAAVGAGFQLALACDLRIATPAARFSMREATLGLVPDLTGTHPLVRLIGYSRALEICATSRWVAADEAYHWGLVNSVSNDLLGDITALVAHLLDLAPATLRETKALLQSAQDLTPADQRIHEREAQVRLIKGTFGSP